MDQNMKEISNKDKNGEKVSSFGLMDLSIVEIGWKTIYKELESINGQMVCYILVNGNKTKCMEVVSKLGLMEGNMKVNTTTA